MVGVATGDGTARLAEVTLDSLGVVAGLGMANVVARSVLFSICVTCTAVIGRALGLSKAKWSSATEPDSSLDRFFDGTSGPSRPWAMLLAGFVVCVMTYQFRQVGLQPGPAIAPDGALQYLKQSGIAGHGFNHYNYGGYLIWSDIPVFMDGRIDLRGDAVMKPYNDALTQTDPKDLAKILDAYQVAWTMFPPEGIPAINMNFMLGWSKAYADENAVIHVRLKNN